MIYLQKVVIDQNRRSQSSTEKAKFRCGMTDVNAAKNILAAGHRRLAVGISSL